MKTILTYLLILMLFSPVIYLVYLDGGLLSAAIVTSITAAAIVALDRLGSGK
jgi:hypothetical protein